MANLYFKVQADYEEVMRLRAEVENLETALRNADGSMPIDRIRELESSLADAREQMNGLITAASAAATEMESRFESAQASVQALADALNIGNSPDTPTQTQPAEMNISTDSAISELGKLDAEFQRLADSFADYFRWAFENVGEGLQQLRNNFIDLLDIKRQASDAQTPDGEGVNDLLEKNAQLTAELQRMKQALEESQRQMSQMSNILQTQGVPAATKFVQSVTTGAQQLSKSQARKRASELTKLIEEEEKSVVNLNKEIERVQSNLAKLQQWRAAPNVTGNEATRLDAEIENGKKTLEDVKESLSASKDNLAQWKGELAQINESFEQTGQKVPRIRTQIMQAREDLIRMREAGMQMTPQYLELAQHAGKLRRQMTLVNAEMQFLASPNKGLLFTKSLLQGVAGSAALVTGVMGLFNSKSEEMVKIQTKIQSLLAVTLGIEKAYQLVKKSGMVMRGIEYIQLLALDKAIKLETSATKGATIAQKAFNAVAMANPYVLLATAVLAVVGAMAGLMSMKSDTVELAEATDKFGESAADTTRKVETLAEVVRATTDTSKPHKQAMSELEQMLKEYNITLDKNLLKEEALLKAKLELIQAIKEEAKQRKIANQIAQFQIQADEQGKKLEEAIKKAIESAEWEDSGIFDNWDADEFIKKFGSAAQVTIRSEIDAMYDEMADGYLKLEDLTEDVFKNRLKKAMQDAGYDVSQLQFVAGAGQVEHDLDIYSEIFGKAKDYLTVLQVLGDAQKNAADKAEEHRSAEENLKPVIIDEKESMEELLEILDGNIGALQMIDQLDVKPKIEDGQLKNTDELIQALRNKFLNLDGAEAVLNVGANINVPQWLNDLLTGKTLSAADIQKYTRQFQKVVTADTVVKAKVSNPSNSPAQKKQNQSAIDKAFDNTADTDTAQKNYLKGIGAGKTNKGKGGGKGGRGGKSATEKAQDEEVERMKKELADRRRFIDELQELNEKELDVRKDSSQKRLEQIELSRKKELEANRRSQEDLLIQKQDEAQKEWYKNPKNKNKKFDRSSVKLDETDLNFYLQKEQLINREADAQTGKEINEEAERRERQVQEYNKTYGNLFQKIVAIKADYYKKIADAEERGDEWEAKKIQKDMDSDVLNLKFKDFQQSPEYVQAFKSLGDMPVSSLEKLKEKLEGFKATAATVWEGQPDKLREYIDLLNQVQTAIENGKDIWTQYAEARSEYQRELELAKNETDESKKAEHINKAIEAYNKMKKAEEKVQQKADKLATATVNIGRQAQQLAAVWSDDVADGIGVAVDSLETVKDVAGQVYDAMKILTTKTATQIADTANAVSAGTKASAKSASSSISALEKASAVLAIIGAAIQLATMVANLFNNDKAHERTIERLQEQIDKLQRSYDRLGRKIEEAYSVDASQMIEQQNTLLRQQQALIRQQIAEEEAKKKTDSDKIRQWKEQLEDITDTIEENVKKAIDAITGTSLTSAIDEIADAWADAWTNGTTAVRSATDVIKKLLKQGIIEYLKKVVSPDIEKWYNKMASALADGTITAAERGLLDKEMGYITDKANQYYEQVKDYFLEDSDNGGGTRTAFEGMNQETSEELNGRFTALQIAGEAVRQNTTTINSTLTEMKLTTSEMLACSQNIYQVNREALKITADSYLELVGIRQNTFAIIEPILKMSDNIEKVERNTSKL